MIELNRIRSIKTLEELKKDLSDFINFDRVVLLEVYIDNDKDEIDLDADLEEAAEVLDKVKYRIKSLGDHMSRSVIRERNVRPQSDVTVSEIGEQSPS